MRYLDRARTLLEAIKAQDRYRIVSPDSAPKYAADFSTNDYLALASDSRVVEALRRAQRVGSGGARLLGGRSREHWLLEEELAQFLGRERTLLFSSGYLAALGAITVLAQTVNVAYSDERNHASLIDGLRMTKLQRHIYSHATLPSKGDRQAPALIVTESIFSMDGDRADIGALVADLHEGDVLLVDEAHAIGVAGAMGAGICREFPDERVVVMGTLSKSFGALGGFVAGPAELIDLLANAARTFIFDTALPPSLATAARVALMLSKNMDDRRARIAHVSARLTAAMDSLGYHTHGAQGPIVPVIIGSEAQAMQLSQALLLQHICAPAVRPPTVPTGTSRLRLSVRADHNDQHVDILLEALQCIVSS